MQTFATTRDAKEYLIAKIVGEAQHEEVELSEVERKMLYFSETAWTLPEMTETSDAFDRDYDDAIYEQKIGALAHNYFERVRKTSRDDCVSWNQAAHKLSTEDHYLLVLIAPSQATRFSRIPSWLKLIAIVIVVLLLLLAKTLFVG